MLKPTAVAVALLALLILGVWALPAAHDDGSLSGSWRFTVRLEQTGQSTVRFLLRQDGEQLDGTYDGAYGRQPITGTVVGDRIEFSFPAGDGSVVTYRGTVGERTMEGVCDYGDLAGTGTWTAERGTALFEF